MSVTDTHKDPHMTAAIDMLRRTGARSFQMRYSDEEEPVVWIAVVQWRIEDGEPVAQGGEIAYEAAAALNPTDAAERLLVRVLDDGHCKHCDRLCAVGFEHDDLPQEICWYTYDSEGECYRRSCEEGG